MVAQVHDFSASTEETSISLSLSSSSSSSSEASFPSSFDCTFPPPTIHIVSDYTHPSDLDEEEAEEDAEEDAKGKENITPPPRDTFTSHPYAQLLFDAAHNTLVTAMEVCLVDGFRRRLTSRRWAPPPEMMLASDDDEEDGSDDESTTTLTAAHDIHRIHQKGDLHIHQAVSNKEDSAGLPVQEEEQLQQDEEYELPQYHFDFYWMDANYEYDYYDDDSDTQLYLLHDMSDPWVSSNTRRSSCHRSCSCRGGSTTSATGCGETLKKLLSSALLCISATSLHNYNNTTTGHWSGHQTRERRGVRASHNTANTFGSYPLTNRFMNQFYGYQVLPN
jgi:hypothetical protein